MIRDFAPVRSEHGAPHHVQTVPAGDDGARLGQNHQSFLARGTHHGPSQRRGLHDVEGRHSGADAAHGRRYARFGITFNAVAPGRVRTALAEEAAPQVELDYAQRAPVGRIVRPEEVAAANAFLAPEEAGFISGAVIDVYGGLAML